MKKLGIGIAFFHSFFFQPQGGLAFLAPSFPSLVSYYFILFLFLIFGIQFSFLLF